jgi:hypothetical protein
MRTLTELSVRGARFATRRLDYARNVAEMLSRPPLSEEAAVALLAVFFRRIGRADEIAADLAMPYTELLASLKSLASVGALERVRAPASVRGEIVRPCYRLSPNVQHTIRSRVTDLTRGSVERP